MFKSIRVGSRTNPDWTIVGVFAEQRTLPKNLEVTAAARKTLNQGLKTAGFKADVGELIPAGTDHLLVGLGKKSDLDEAALRSLGARLSRRLGRYEPRAIDLMISETLPAKSVDAQRAGQCVGEGMGLANWRVDFFDGEATKSPKLQSALSVNAADKAFRDGLKRGLTLADSANYARRLAATPPNICHPPWLASEVRKMAREVGLGCQVISDKQAQQLGMGGLVNVGKGSAQRPCMIVLEHKPTKIAASAKGERIVLVGKTMTYDSGGYSLKINNSMKGMKYDKNGGMAVLGAMRAIAQLKLPVHVTALLPAAENMVSDIAYRPDDIITMYNGVTVEVTNTDAEGRLILGDALAYACKKLKPTAIIDAATLTGGVVVALGAWCAGLWCNDENLQERVEDAADRSGERVWQLPLWDGHRDFMRSKHADIWNSAPKRDGHAIQGAAFLSFFVDEDVPWAHLDIAGMSAVDGDKEPYVHGPTGFGVRLLADLVEGWC